ncbi:MAG: ribose-5-phosphate isomerase RpiA [Thermoplasmataceae archaeon]
MDSVLEKEKRSAAVEAAKYVKSGSIIGLGTGSTTHYFILELASLVKNGYDVKCMASSVDTEKKARNLGIEIISTSNELLDAYFDGADEIEPGGSMIKGGGGALTKEKILAKNSKEFNVMIDSSKMKLKLGKFGVPVEVLEFGLEFTKKNIEQLGCVCRIRKDFTTDSGNLILDCDFGLIQNTVGLESLIKSIPGVVEVGIFNGMAKRIFQGKGNQCLTIEL